MRERAARLGGKLQVESRVGGGTTVELVARVREA
jgi:nitrate/nitrite-specific signal transduction histidine kinase